MKKLIVMAMLALMSVCAFSGETGNVISDLYQQYTELTALSKSKGISKAEKADYAAQAKAVLQEAKYYGTLAGDVSVGTFKGIAIPPEKWVSLYKESCASAEVVDVYNFKFSVKWPYVTKGIRTYKTSTLKGWFVIEYAESGSVPTKAYVVVKNGNTKGIHYIDCTENSAYWLMGKSNKYITHIEPSLYFEAVESDSPEATTTELHEKIKKVTFCGGGSLSAQKVTSTTKGCGACGIQTVASTSYCVKLTKGSGYVTGVMDCECPDDENWDHTVYASSCGVYVDAAEGGVIRSHEAAFGGTWAMSYNKTLSVVNKNGDID